MAEHVANWKMIHDRLVGLARAQAVHDYEIGRWLLAAERARVDARLGYGSPLEYGERLFGQTRRMIAERLRVARALEQLPALAEALRGGALGWSAARELSRVAVVETAADWIEAARGRTVREVEAMVSGRRPGDRPADPPREEARRHVLRFEVSGETLALVREARAKVTRDAGGHLSDDEALTLFARAALGGPADAGRAGYQVAVTVCPCCERASQRAGGADVTIGAAAAEAAVCDAQVIDMTACGAANDEGATHRGRGSGAASDEGATHRGRGSGAAGRPPRATQSIPPATRRLVVRRDGGRCVVPGCAHTIVDCHHLRRRADGGGHDPDGLALLCTIHHKRAHEGALVIGGSPSTGLRFSHADGTPYGEAPAVAAAAAFAEGFQGLVTLGFTERQARGALDAIRSHVGNSPATEEVLRAALAALRPAA